MAGRQGGVREEGGTHVGKRGRKTEGERNTRRKTGPQGIKRQAQNMSKRDKQS